jgi:hypothetical protein
MQIEEQKTRDELAKLLKETEAQVIEARKGEERGKKLRMKMNTDMALHKFP